MTVMNETFLRGRTIQNKEKSQRGSKYVRLRLTRRTREKLVPFKRACAEIAD